MALFLLLDKEFRAKSICSERTRTLYRGLGDIRHFHTMQAILSPPLQETSLDRIYNFFFLLWLARVRLRLLFSCPGSLAIALSVRTFSISTYISYVFKLA